jgi:peptide/nickel transport system permease protein
MKQYFLRRLFWFLPTLLGSLTLVFFLMHLVPGDPVDAMLGETASPADKEALRRELGLDRPLVEQYGRFLGGLAAGDLGRSLSQGEAVLDLILSRLPATLELSLAAMALGLLVAIPLGIMAAVKHRSWIDQTSLLISLLGLSMPNFWLGPLLIILFSIELGWLPVSGRGGPQHLVLPALTLGLSLSAILTRMLRSSLLEVIHEEFIRTARAKGLSEPRVWLKHALRNALNSCITIVGLQCGSLLAGAIITETIFSWPGIGRLTLQAIQMRDYPLAQGCILVISVGYLVVNFLTDLLYRVADPRITYAR